MEQAIIFHLLTIAWINLAAGRNPMENPGMYDGDMLGVELDGDRNAVPTDSLIWPNGVIPYVIDSKFPYNHLMVLYDAMNYIEQKTCIRFVPRKNESDFVKIFQGEGCYATWGRRGNRQLLSLGERCDYLGVTLHELMHAIGFEHEHNRPDRDNYLTIYWDNIPESQHYAFQILKPHETRVLTPFDYDSIMLYGSKAFVKDFAFNSMLTIDGKFLNDNYERTEMSPSDIRRVKLLYRCPN